MVTDARHYERWTGAMRRDLDDARVLHYWGQFTPELPAPYTMDGGHAYRESASFEELRRDLDALLAAVKKTFPDAKVEIDEEDGAAHVMLPDNRQMWIEFRATTHYDAAILVPEDEEEDDDEYVDRSVWVHGYQTSRGDKGSAVFWDKQGAGWVSIGLTKERDELVLLRTWVDEDRFQATAKELVDSPSEGERVAEGAELNVASERIIAAYSPHSWMHIVGPERLEKLVDELEGMEPDEAREKLYQTFRAHHEDRDDDAVDLTVDGAAIATAVRLLPGTYDVSFGSHDPEGESDEDGWSCIWCRFKRR